MTLQGFTEHALKCLIIAIFLKERQPGHGPIEGVVDITARSTASLA
jgi:hypothetical protein